MHDWNNQAMADKLLEMADLLDQQDANPFRVGAYRRAARTVAGYDGSIADLAEREGVDGLAQLPAIGRSIALAIQEMLYTGRWMILERVRGSLDPEQVFQGIPGIGPQLARAIHGELEIETLEALERAAHDGRLKEVPGIGPRRCRMIAATLSQMLQSRRGRPRSPAEEPPVKVLLDVDREYREKAAAGELRKIAPRRFNPANRAWLPILHTHRAILQHRPGPRTGPVRIAAYGFLMLERLSGRKKRHSIQNTCLTRRLPAARGWGPCSAMSRHRLPPAVFASPARLSGPCVEVLRLIQEAIELHLQSLLENGEHIQPPSSSVEYVHVAA